MATVNSIDLTGAQPASKALDEKSKVRLQKAVKDFEAMFVGYMLKSMRNTVPKEEMFGDSFGGDMLDSMFDLELARQMSRNSNFGVGEMLYREMTGEKLPRARGHTTSHASPALKAPVEIPQPVQKAAAPEQPAAKRPEPGRPVAAGNEAAVVDRIQAYEPLILEAADKHGLDPNLLRAVIASESGGKVDARSSKNAKGLMQLIDSTAHDMGVNNIWNPRENILGGAKYLHQLMQRFQGNLQHVIASYNAGPGTVEKHGGIPPIRETQNYVTRVMQYLRRFEQQETSDDE